MDTPALHYNLGATLYKRGRYPQAREAFESCARDPAWAPLAHYNLGLVALRQGKSATAADHFAEAWRTTEDTKLAALALTMLGRIDPMAYWRPRGQLSFGLGYDSNVLLSDHVPGTSATGKSDRYTEFLAAATAQLGSGANAPRWEAAIYDLRYFDLTDYSLSDFLLGLSLPWRSGAWRFDAGGQSEKLWRDGNGYQRIIAFKAGAMRELDKGRTLRLEFRHDWINPTDPAYQYLDGTRLDIGASLAQIAGEGWMSYGASFERNDREDLVVGGEFFSYSPIRAVLWLKGSWPLDARWQLEPAVRYRHSRYADADRRAGGVEQTREDSDWQAGLRVRHRLTGGWQMTGEFTVSENRSNFDEFSYTRRQVLFGFSYPL
jgi:hypothetical protein